MAMVLLSLAEKPFQCFHHRHGSQGLQWKSTRPACEQSSSGGRGAWDYAYTSPSVRFSIANTAVTVYSLTISSHIHTKLGREGAALAQSLPLLP